MRVVGAHAPAVAAAPGAEPGIRIVQARFGEQHELWVESECECGGHGVTRRLYRRQLAGLDGAEVHVDEYRRS